MRSKLALTVVGSGLLIAIAALTFLALNAYWNKANALLLSFNTNYVSVDSNAFHSFEVMRARNSGYYGIMYFPKTAAFASSPWLLTYNQLTPAGPQQIGSYSLSAADASNIFPGEYIDDRHIFGLDIVDIADYKKDKLASIRFKILDMASGDIKDVTPAGLGTEGLGKGSKDYLFTYGQHGVSLLIKDDKSDAALLLQGIVTAKVVQIIPDVVCSGRTSVKGKLTSFIVTKDGTAYYYDYDTGRMITDTKHAALAKAIVTAYPGKPWGGGVFMTDTFVVWSERNPRRFVFLDAKGKSTSLVCFDVYSYKPNGRRRSAAEEKRARDAIMYDEHAFAEEGLRANPNCFTSSTNIELLDERSILLSDDAYLRYTAVSIADESK